MFFLDVLLILVPGFLRDSDDEQAAFRSLVDRHALIGSTGGLAVVLDLLAGLGDLLGLGLAALVGCVLGLCACSVDGEEGDDCD